MNFYSGMLVVVMLSMPFIKAEASSNLVVNGSFDHANSPLFGWKYNYEDTGNKNYADNHEFVSVVKQDGSRRNVLRLKATAAKLDVEGVKVDSAPIPVEQGVKYKLSAWARSKGANCRILIEGYRWRPGIKPHENPELSELRKCYKFQQLYFGETKSGTKGGVGGRWSRASRTLPEDNLSKLAQKHLNKTQFFVIHIIAISGNYDLSNKDPVYSLNVDDVVLERVN